MTDTSPRSRRKRGSAPPGPSWSVFTLFRRNRLALGRGFPTYEAARDFALRLRGERFHDRDAIHVVDDTTGERCALPAGEDTADIIAPPSASVSTAPAASARRAGFTIYASFHRGRIPLARRVDTIGEAMAVVERFRRNRFDSSQRLVIVDEATGESMMPDEVQGVEPPGPSRERLLELHALAQKVLQPVAAYAARERSPDAEARRRALEEVCNALLEHSNHAPAAGRRTRPPSGVRNRTVGAA